MSVRKTIAPDPGTARTLAADAPKVLFAAGGSGGHVYPALAVADALVDHGIASEFIGVEGRFEAKAVPAAGWPLHIIDAPRLGRLASMSTLTLPMRIARTAADVADHIRDRGYSAVVGFGGYTQVATTLAARRTATPLIIHEANAAIGKANRFAARTADVVAASFPSLRMRLARGVDVVVTGQPVRHDVYATDRDDARARGQRRFRLSDAPTILLFGGSQGAEKLSKTLVAAYRLWSVDPLQILHITGEQHLQRQEEAWEAARATGPGPTVRVVPFVEDMTEAYATADVVVARAGASTVFELCGFGLPAVLVPLPRVGSGAQLANARAIERIGAGVVLPNDELSARALVDRVEGLLLDDATREQMGLRARAFARPGAEHALARLIVEYSRAPKQDAPTRDKASV